MFINHAEICEDSLANSARRGMPIEAQKKERSRSTTAEMWNERGAQTSGLFVDTKAMRNQHCVTENLAQPDEYSRSIDGKTT